MVVPSIVVITSQSRIHTCTRSYVKRTYALGLNQHQADWSSHIYKYRHHRRHCWCWSLQLPRRFFSPVSVCMQEMKGGRKRSLPACAMCGRSCGCWPVWTSGSSAENLQERQTSAIIVHPPAHSPKSTPFLIRMWVMASMGCKSKTESCEAEGAPLKIRGQIWQLSKTLQFFRARHLRWLFRPLNCS